MDLRKSMFVAFFFLLYISLRVFRAERGCSPSSGHSGLRGAGSTGARNGEERGAHEHHRAAELRTALGLEGTTEQEAAEERRRESGRTKG